MNLYINNTKVDVTLEKEETVYEVLKEVQQWLEDQKLFITELLIDKKDCPLDEIKLMTQNISEVTDIEIKALNPYEIEATSLQMVYQMLSLIRVSYTEQNVALLSKLKDDYSYMQDIFHTVFSESDMKTLMSYLEELGFFSEKFAESPDFTLLDAYLTITKSKLNEYLDPLSEIKSITALCETIMPELENIPVQLQTGKDKQAMHNIVKLTEILDKFIRVYKILLHTNQELDNIRIESVPFQEYYQDFSKILHELADAFTNNDSVLIGDIVEYEIIQRLQKLIQYLNKFKEALK